MWPECTILLHEFSILVRNSYEVYQTISDADRARGKFVVVVRCDVFVVHGRCNYQNFSLWILLSFTEEHSGAGELVI